MNLIQYSHFAIFNALDQIIFTYRRIYEKMIDWFTFTFNFPRLYSIAQVRFARDGWISLTNDICATKTYLISFRHSLYRNLDATSHQECEIVWALLGKQFYIHYSKWKLRNLRLFRHFNRKSTYWRLQVTSFHFPLPQLISTQSSIPSIKIFTLKIGKNFESNYRRYSVHREHAS